MNYIKSVIITSKGEKVKNSLSIKCIVLSVLRVADSDYFFGIFKLFLHKTQIDIVKKKMIQKWRNLKTTRNY